MQTKDYYTILGLPSSASLKEIRSAYRRLAHQFHPDKNGNDPYATSQFELIKEAYEVLSSPLKKAHYLQQRWYDQVMYKIPSVTPVTPVTVLKQCIELDQYVARLDVHRMDRQGLYSYITNILSDEVIEKLNAFNEKDINSSIVESVLKSCRNLPLNFAKPLSARLMKVNMDSSTLENIRSFVLHSKSTYRWNQYKIWLLLLITALICLLIYVISS